MTPHNPNPNPNPNHNKIIHHHKNHHLPPITTTTGRSNSTIQACAACRYQRRKCAPDCLLAPYFPHDRQRQFQNAHKLFGVSNITKIIRNLDQQQKEEAMRTIIYQSDVRAHDPVGGCLRIVRELHRQIEISRNELELVYQQLALCRTLAVQNQNQNQNQNQTHNNQQFNHDRDDQIVIDEIDYDIQLTVANNQDELNHDLDLQIVTLQPQEEQQQEKFVTSKDGIWEVVAPEQPWTSPVPVPASQTLHASVCDNFKSLLINDIAQGDETGFKEIHDQPSEETLYNEENNKGLIKEENLCYYNEEEYEMKNATFGTLTDCKAIQVEGDQ